MVELYIDSSKIEEVKEFMKWGVFTGATTNQSILAKDGCKSIEEMKIKIKEIAELIGPTSIEVFSKDTNGMVREAEEYSMLHRNIVIKIPSTEEGLKAVPILKNKKIKINFTACMSVNQAILAALAGADYISLFYGRIGDCGYDPYEVIKQTTEILRNDPKLKNSKIIVGSMRSLLDINRSIMAGADIITITPPLLKKMPYNPQTEKTVDEFLDSWKNFSNKEPEKSVQDIDKAIELLKSVRNLKL